MELPITEAKGKLTDLVRRAEAGETVILTRHGQPVADIVPRRDRLPAAAILALIASVQKEAAAMGAKPMPHDLYDENGLPC
ncbi:type II toxin-antitoxin system Phd/YefM family antitoxin [Paracoccus ravus]|uniref:type II toxin-antitoxin system Phd/YefM family antitoxin n=1 Tax=Paracoccus ravus TaxID=2447760 RepID=UPI00106E2194|nr:type II toxin-antitoxin system prevent-host-death family antitoxin [Paracoccus ravus]